MFIGIFLLLNRNATLHLIVLFDASFTDIFAEINILLTDHSNATELVTNGNAVRMNPNGDFDDVRTFHICDDKL